MDTWERPVVTIEGAAIALGPLRRELIPLYARWQGDILVQRTYRTPGPVTIEEATAWFEPRAAGGGDCWFTIYERATWRPIGYTEIDGIDWRVGTAGFGILIGEADGRGRGYGTETTRLMLDFAFTALGLRNVMLTTDAFNLAALSAYRKAGFTEIGRRRQCSLLNGQFHDVVFMDCLASEFASPVLGTIFVPDEQRTERTMGGTFRLTSGSIPCAGSSFIRLRILAPDPRFCTPVARLESLLGGTPVPLTDWRKERGRGGAVMLLTRCRQRLARIVAVMQHAFRGYVWVRPAAAHAAGTGTDLLRSRAQLLAENALLRQQVLVLRRSGTRPAVTATDRALLGCSLAASAPGARR